MAGRLPALRRFAKGRRFDLALAHGSHEAMLVARSLGIPGCDRARLRVRDGCSTSSASGPRAASSSRTPSRPSASPATAPEAAEARAVPGARGGVLPRRLRARPGRRWTASTPDKVLAVVRTPPDVSLYHRHGNPLLQRRARAARPRRVRARDRPAANERAARRDPGARCSRRCTSPSTPSTPRALSLSPTSSSRPAGR